MRAQANDPKACNSRGHQVRPYYATGIELPLLIGVIDEHGIEHAYVSKQEWIDERNARLFLESEKFTCGWNDDYSLECRAKLIDKWNTRTHGTLTAEQVRKAIFVGGIWDEDNAMYYVNRTDMQTIADELNAMLCGGRVNEDSIDKWLREFQIAHGELAHIGPDELKDLAFALHDDIPLGYEASMRLGQWLLNAELGSGTCDDLGGIGANGESVFHCSKCGCILSLYDSEGVNTLCTSFICDYPRFCPECGARIRKAVER